MPEAMSLPPQPRAGLRTWLFNPFVYIAGWQSLLLGLVAILAAGLLGFFSNTHFDGVLDMHTGLAAPLSLFLAEGIIDWLTLGIVLLVIGKIVSHTSFRVIDVLGTQALARGPMLLAAAVSLVPSFQRVLSELMGGLARPGGSLNISLTDGLLFGLAMLVSLLALIWMVALMYRAYTLCCNVKGSAAIISFIVALIIAEIVSKLAIYKLVAG